MIRATCIVPEEFSAYTWPERFVFLPREGERVQPAESDSIQLVVEKIVHRNHEKMHQPPEYETKIDIYLRKSEPKVLVERARV